MNVGQASPTAPAKPSILLMDINAERRTLRKKVLSLHGVEVIFATDLVEASSIWHRDRYDLVLMDIRRDHYGCLAWRDEIKKENPNQIVAFLVGPPRFVELEPLQDSYVTEKHGDEWGESLRQAVREACGSLPQRNGFVEVGYRIAAARKLSGLPPRTVRAVIPDDAPGGGTYDSIDDQYRLSPTAAAPEDSFRDDASRETENT
jgi:CheY-like chemotaxis protein